MPIRVDRWQPIHRGQLVGKVDVILAGALIIFDCRVLLGSTGAWVALPARPKIGRDDRVTRDDNGKVIYVSVLKWTGRDATGQWSSAVIASLVAQYGPAVLQGGRP